MSWGPFRSFNGSYYDGSGASRRTARYYDDDVVFSPSFRNHGSGASGGRNSDFQSTAHPLRRNPYANDDIPFIFDPGSTGRRPRPAAGSAGDNFWTSERTRLNRMTDTADERDHNRRRDLADQESVLNEAALQDGYIRYADGEYRPRRRRYQPGFSDYARSRYVEDVPGPRNYENPTSSRRRSVFTDCFSSGRREDDRRHGTDEDEEFRRVRPWEPSRNLGSLRSSRSHGGSSRPYGSSRRPYWV